MPQISPFQGNAGWIGFKERKRVKLAGFLNGKRSMAVFAYQGRIPKRNAPPANGED